MRPTLLSALGLSTLLLACFSEERDEGDEGVSPGIYEDTGSSSSGDGGDGGGGGDTGSEWGDGGDGGGGDGGGGDGGDGGDGGGDGGGGGGDNDGDGYTSSQGDCDDNDASVNPGVYNDGCDGEDEDCDGLTDEDFSGDYWEPNDDGYHYYNDLSDITGETYQYEAYINPESDVDAIYYYVDDGWLDSYGVGHYLYAPSTVDIVVSLWWLRDDASDWEELGTLDASGTGGDEEYWHDGGYTSSDSGWFLAAIYSAGGSSCSESYLFEINATGSWW